MEQMVSATSPSPTRERLLRRAAVAFLYAHWEGFIKQATTTYLDFVHHQRLKNRDLSPTILSLSARSLVNSATGANAVVVHLAVAQFFVEQSDDEAKIPYANAVRTSNLTYSEFHDITTMLGLDLVARETETKAKLIDEELVKNRNRIAHGEYLTVDKPQYTLLNAEIIKIITLFYNELLNAAFEQRYRRL